MGLAYTVRQIVLISGPLRGKIPATWLHGGENFGRIAAMCTAASVSIQASPEKYFSPFFFFS